MNVENVQSSGQSPVFQILCILSSTVRFFSLFLLQV